MILWKNVAFGVLMALLGIAAVAYARAMRRWTSRMREVAQRSPDPNVTAQFMETEEYRELRRRAQRPMFAATVIFLALVILTRYG
jgi:hypothetical protein